jgi:glycosyltransferase involved in cell wall biosynthesis
MKVLLLAPQPFYQLRGTPIAVKRLAEAFSRRGWLVDILAFHEGSAVGIPNVRIFRIPRIPGTRGVRPGFSLKKVICDLALFAKAARMVRHERYDLIHAGEESAFIALLFRWAAGYPYIYDMDSCLSEQMAGSHPSMKPLLPIIQWLEGIVIRNASAVLAVCDALAEYARAQGARHVVVLPDAPLCAPPSEGTAAAKWSGGAATRATFMYIGNLEHYQGIDLLLDAFSRFAGSDDGSTLEIIGGAPAHIAHYTGVCRAKNIADRVRFRGEQPPERLGEFMAEADVLVSPRCQGVNTPMKIYSYLQAGKAVLATDIPSHSQVLSAEFAFLAPPEPDAFARAMARLASDPALRTKLGEQALRIARTRYAPENFDRTAFVFCGLAERVLVKNGHPGAVLDASPQ